MKIEITEEEREFLERVCLREEMFAVNNLFATTGKNDLEKISGRTDEQ